MVEDGSMNRLLTRLFILLSGALERRNRACQRIGIIYDGSLL
jgi:hypothetical protein